MAVEIQRQAPQETQDIVPGTIAATWQMMPLSQRRIYFAMDICIDERVKDQLVVAALDERSEGTMYPEDLEPISQRTRGTFIDLLTQQQVLASSDTEWQKSARVGTIMDNLRVQIAHVVPIPSDDNPESNKNYSEQVERAFLQFLEGPSPESTTKPISLTATRTTDTDDRLSRVEARNEALQQEVASYQVLIRGIWYLIPDSERNKLSLSQRRMVIDAVTKKGQNERQQPPVSPQAGGRNAEKRTAVRKKPIAQETVIVTASAIRPATKSGGLTERIRESLADLGEADVATLGQRLRAADSPYAAIPEGEFYTGLVSNYLNLMNEVVEQDGKYSLKK